MNTSKETTTNSENDIKFDHKGFMRSSLRSSTKTLSLKPTRSFGRAKSLRPKAVLSTKKEDVKVSED